MTAKVDSSKPDATSALALLEEQRSHLLVVLSQPIDDGAAHFDSWFAGPYHAAILGMIGVVRARHYRRHDLDITRGRHFRIPYDFLGIYELSLDGGDRAEGLIREIRRLHCQSGCAAPPATWLFFPIGEKVGRSVPDAPYLTVAYANPIAGTELAFREFYATRHVRHALHIPALASGQCFERSMVQRPGSMQPIFQMLAFYEQIAEPQAIIDAFSSLKTDTLEFPMLDKAHGRFAECSYRLLA